VVAAWSMANRPQLASITSSLDDIASRVTEVAEAESASGDGGMARELFAVERALGEALRRLHRLSG